MTLTSTTTRPPAYGQALAELILARSDEPGYAPAGRLPTERQLAAEFGVTRTMVRHALAVLEAKALVSREVGRGTFLTSAATRGGVGARASLEHDDSEVGPADVMAARRLIEPRVLPLVVAYATQRDFDEMRRCLVGGAAAQSAEEFEAWDFALHHALVAAGRNQLLVAMYRTVELAREGEIWGSLKRRNDSRERREEYQEHHVEIVRAVCARELDEATAAMEAHLASVEAHLLAASATPVG
jgi:DNA-binding FadR family transcriptional regulator